MVASAINAKRLARQEESFVRAFESGDLEVVRPLYHPEVLYLSPTVRLYDRSERIEGVDATLAFIALTIEKLEDIRYAAVEQAVLPGDASAFVRVHFDWQQGGVRLRSNYVVLYRYRDGRIGQQELYYDPSGKLEVLRSPER